MRPLIGITTGTLTPVMAQGITGRGTSGYYSFQDYVQAVVAAGGAPVLIPVLDDAEALRALFDRLSGLVLSGGPDVQPFHYGEEPHPKVVRLDPTRDTMELMLARWCLEHDRPVLAICRGHQVLNVALGGTLYQDIPSQAPGSLNHYPPNSPRSYIAHTISVEPTSRLASILQCQSIGVNSMHHQAIRKVGEGLNVTAHAPDGTIEAVESAAYRFVVGVQFHPEELYDTDEHIHRLFAALVQQSAAEA